MIDRCAHETCDCPVEDGDAFCSAACEDATAAKEVGPCPCGHGECAEALEDSMGAAM